MHVSKFDLLDQLIVLFKNKPNATIPKEWFDNFEKLGYSQKNALMRCIIKICKDGY